MTRGGWSPERERRLLLAVIASNENIRYKCDHIGALCGETRDAVGHKLRSMKPTIKEMRQNKASGLLPDTAPTPSKKRKSTASPSPKKAANGITVAENGFTNSEPLSKKFKMSMKEEDDNDNEVEVLSDDGSEHSMPNLGSDSGSEFGDKKAIKEEDTPIKIIKRQPSRRAAPARGAYKEEETSEDEVY